MKNAGFVVSELVAGSGEQEDTRNKKLKDIFLVRKSAVNTTTSNQRNCHLRHDCHWWQEKKQYWKKVMTLLYNPDQNYLIPRLLRNTVCAVYLLTGYICVCQDYMWNLCVILIMKVLSCTVLVTFFFTYFELICQT